MSPQNLNIEMYSVSHETWQLQDDLKVVVDLWNNLRYLFSYHFVICYLISVQQFLEAGIKFIIPNHSIIFKKVCFTKQVRMKTTVLLQWIPDIWIHSKSAWNVVLKLILKCLTAVTLSHWSAQKESCWDVRSFKGLNTIYENISK